MNTPFNSRCGCQSEGTAFCRSNSWRTREGCRSCSEGQTPCEAAATSQCGLSAQRACSNPSSTSWKRRGTDCPSLFQSDRPRCETQTYGLEARDNGGKARTCDCQTRDNGYLARRSTCSGTCNRCGATAEEPICCLSGRSRAMVYSPHQAFENLYDPKQGLCNGTVFSDLYKPFLAYRRA